MGEAATSRLTQLHEGTPGLPWWRNRAVRRKFTSRGLRHWAGEPAGHLGAESSPSRRTAGPASARKTSPPCLSTLIAQVVPGAVHECDVPVPPCSAFRLLSSLSYSHAWPPFAVAKATQVCTRNRTSPVAAEEPPSSRDPITRPLRRSPRHPRLSLRPPTSVHLIVWCGDTPVVLRSLDDRCGERHKRANRAWSARWPASPKGASKVSHEARRNSEECVGSARIAGPSRGHPPWLRLFNPQNAFVH